MEPSRRVLWDAPFHDWLSVFRPTNTQCFHVFSWVLDVTEHGPDPADPDAAEEGVKVVELEEARVTIFYVPWDEPIVAVVEMVSWA